MKGLGSKGGFFDFVMVVGAILVASFLWIVLDDGLVDVQTSLESALPERIGDTEVNQTEIGENLQTGEDIFYYSFFLITFALIFYAIKKTVEDKRVGVFG